MLFELCSCSGLVSAFVEEDCAVEVIVEATFDKAFVISVVLGFYFTFCIRHVVVDVALCIGVYHGVEGVDEDHGVEWLLVGSLHKFRVENLCVACSALVVESGKLLVELVKYDRFAFFLCLCGCFGSVLFVVGNGFVDNLQGFGKLALVHLQLCLGTLCHSRCS